ncbi:uncharacterized protein LOC144164987 isoform X1 [Haemaphysalis longicornis]
MFYQKKTFIEKRYPHIAQKRHVLYSHPPRLAKYFYFMELCDVHIQVFESASLARRFREWINIKCEFPRKCKNHCALIFLYPGGDFVKCEAATTSERAYGLFSMGKEDKNDESSDNFVGKVRLGTYMGSPEDILNAFKVYEKKSWKGTSAKDSKLAKLVSPEDIQNGCLAWAIGLTHHVNIMLTPEADAFIKGFETDKKLNGQGLATATAIKKVQRMFSAPKNGPKPENVDETKFETDKELKGQGLATATAIKNVQRMFSAPKNGPKPENVDETKFETDKELKGQGLATATAIKNVQRMFSAPKNGPKPENVDETKFETDKELKGQGLATATAIKNVQRMFSAPKNGPKPENVDETKVIPPKIYKSFLTMLI